jgi:uncharacterized damage-inducible protein DinB
MTKKTKYLKAFANLGFDRLERATKDLKPEQLDWKSCPQANTIRWILTHLSSELHVFIPKIVSGDKNYTPKGWPEDYVGNTSYSLEKIKADLEKGKKNLMRTLNKLKDKDLAEPLDWFYGVQPKENYLMLAISEIIHHEGQIAAILGVEKRMKGT